MSKLVKKWLVVVTVITLDRLRRRILSVQITAAGHLTMALLPPAGSCLDLELVPVYRQAFPPRLIYHGRNPSASNRRSTTTRLVASSSQVTCHPFWKVPVPLHLLRQSTALFHRRPSHHCLRSVAIIEFFPWATYNDRATDERVRDHN